MSAPELPALELKLSFEEEFALAYTFPKELSELDREALVCKLLEIAANVCSTRNLFSDLLRSNCTGESCKSTTPISLSQKFFLEQCAREARTAPIDQLTELAIGLKRQEMIYVNCLNNLKKK